MIGQPIRVKQQKIVTAISGHPRNQVEDSCNHRYNHIVNQQRGGKKHRLILYSGDVSYDVMYVDWHRREKGAKAA